MQRFTTSDGVGLVYRTWGDIHAGGDDGPPPVLLHHGFIANAQLNWVLPGVVDALVAAGRSVVAHDARGHGRSDTPHDPALYGEARMAAASPSWPTTSGSPPSTWSATRWAASRPRSPPPGSPGCDGW